MNNPDAGRHTRTSRRLNERQRNNLLNRCDDCLLERPPCHNVVLHRLDVFQGVQCNRVVAFAAPHSCHGHGDNAFGWQTLGQTCSRGDPGSAICVQRLDDSLNSAIHTRYRSLLRSSSMHEPRDPPSEVVNYFLMHSSIPKT